MKIVVFAGGVGTRLWPLSRKNSPKQFGKVVGDRSTLQQSIDRLLPEFETSDILIATGKQYEDIVRKQLPNIPYDNFIFEPTLQDVGPAIGLTAFLIEKRFKDEPIAILWSDHMLKNKQTFIECLRLAEKQIEENKSDFIFIAQKPRFANQNCGWIELDNKIEEQEGLSIYKFKKLCYRPKLEDAEKFFTKDNYVWNLGYFVTRPKYLISMYQKLMPDLHAKLSQIQESYSTNKFDETLNKIYPTTEKISFDDAILVKLDPENFQVISADLGWSDVGTWDALKEALEENKEQNITIGDVILENTSDTLMFNYSKKLCLGIDLKETIVINTDDVLLICSKNSVPKIKKLVEKLKNTGYEDLV